jgi:hypothetical protein
LFGFLIPIQYSKLAKSNQKTGLYNLRNENREFRNGIYGIFGFFLFYFNFFQNRLRNSETELTGYGHLGVKKNVNSASTKKRNLKNKKKNEKKHYFLLKPLKNC